MPQQDPTKDLPLIREMIRLAEDRRAEALDRLERVNKYNLALIGFAGSFLSLLVTVDFPLIVLRVAGACLIACVLTSLLNVSPKPLKGATILIDEDVEHLKRGGTFAEREYLLAIAELTERAATIISRRVHTKKHWTTLSASFLAISLLSTYILLAYA
jgi:hypothetical protein